MKGNNAAIGERRRIFAWLPVLKWHYVQGARRKYFAPIGWYWLRHVNQQFTLLEGWVAYQDEN